MSHAPTPQQQSCIAAAVDSAIEMLKVEACAGSGKTSTLVMMAEALPVPSLYLAFNKVTATEASEKFPKHVECRTTHSMAYAAHGKKLSEKLSRPQGKYVNVAGTGSEIARFYKIDNVQVDVDTMVPASFIGLLVKETVARFEQSADSAVKDEHIPTMELKQKCHDNAHSVRYVKRIVLIAAEKLWADRTDVKSPVLASHDTYLKLYQLSKPVFGGKQAVYVDEFQDTTPCVLDIIMNQRGRMKIVMVGDARQAIYAWRGAVNAMQMVEAPARGLTKSFRYGQAIADIATAVLEGDMVITGNENIASLAKCYDDRLEGVPGNTPNAREDLGGVVKSKPYTRLFRTNSALLGSAVAAIKQGRKVALEIDVKDFVKFLESAMSLKDGNLKGVKHDSLLAFTTWEEMMAESKADPNIGRVAKAVNDGYATEWINVLNSHKNATNPDITFTTAHKSKGREWSQVIVENDFKSCFNDDGDWTGLSVEEQNLLYVACTRAIDRLEYNATVAEYLNRAKAEEREDVALAA